MQKLNIFFRLTKVDMTKRTVEGIATAEMPDKSGEICDYATTKPFYQKWSDGFKKATGGKSLGNLRAMHSNIAAGKLTDILFDDTAKAIRIVAKVVDDDCWNKVVEGVFTGFSQGGEYINKWADGEFTRYTAEPSEVSLVDNPCLGEATFEIVKADGSTELQKFHVTQSDPEPRKTAPPKQGWQASDGSFHLSKREAEKHDITVAADAEAAKVIGGIKKLVGDLMDDLEKREFSDEERAKLAESGHALPDGSFPIVNEQDLKNAIHAVGRAKDPEKAKAHIKSRAKALGLESLIPEEWKTAIIDGGDVKKDERAAAAVASLAEVIGDLLIKKSDLHPDHVKAVMAIHNAAHAIMGHVHKAMHGEEAWKAEHHTPADKENVEMAHAAAGMIADKCMGMTKAEAPLLSAGNAGHVHAMHKCATDIMDAAHKFLHGSGVSKEMHHTAHDKAQLHKMHAGAHEIAEKCIKMFGAGGAEEGENEKIVKLEKAEALNSSLTKALADVNATVSLLGKRLEHLEKQPAPRKGALFAIDGGRHDPAPGDQDVEKAAAYPLNYDALRLSPEEQRRIAFGK